MALGCGMPANLWCRLWAEMPNDPKWRLISRLSGQEISRVIAVYVHLLSQATTAENRGKVAANADELAAALDLRSEDAQAILDAMKGRVIDDGWLSGWVKRNPMREDNSAERAKEWRERKRTLANAGERKRTLEENREEEKRKEDKKQKPSRGQREVDPRHSEFRELLSRYWESRNHGVEMPWDASEAGALAKFLKASPNMTGQEFRRLLTNRWKSEVNHGERPRVWIGNITNYGAGPIDRFGKPTGGRNGNGNYRDKAEANAAALREALAGGGTVDVDPGGDGDGAGRDGEPDLPAFDGGKVIEAAV